MKKFLAMLGSVLMAGMLVVPAFADSNGVFVDSVGLSTSPKTEDVKVSGSVTVGGQEKTIEDAINSGDVHLVITPASKADEAPGEASKELSEAVKDLNVADAASKIKFAEGSEEKFNKVVNEKANGNAANLVASEVFDVSLVDKQGNVANGSKVTLTIPVADANSIALVLHKPNGEWEVVDFTVSADGKSITFTLDSLSPIALLKVKSDNNGSNNGTKPADTNKPSTTKPGTTTGVTSPQTGVEVNYFFAVAAVLAVCAAGVCVKRAKRA